jgi:hypothetical protein
MNRSKLPGVRSILIPSGYLRYFFSVMLVWACFFPTRSMAQGNLLLTPQRVVFEGSKRIEELNLANIGKDTARYVISLINLRMKEDGGFEEIMQPDTGQNFADKWVRFFPHSVILGPQESQAVKIQLTKPAGMGPGEYRSHIYFRAIPDEQPLGETDTIPDSSISVRLIPIFGVSIPVIIRVGGSTTQTGLSDLALELGKDTVPILNMVFHRTGNMSVYGDISVDHITDQGKKTIRVGVVRGMAVYTPNPMRRFRMMLENIPGVDYHSGKLHIVYTTPSDHKLATIAEAELILR